MRKRNFKPTKRNSCKDEVTLSLVIEGLFVHHLCHLMFPGAAGFLLTCFSWFLMLVSHGCFLAEGSICLSDALQLDI
jgi:hypothetical protein